MSSLTVTCPSCHTALTVPAGAFGQMVACSRCGQQIQLVAPPPPAREGVAAFGDLDGSPPPRPRRRSGGGGLLVAALLLGGAGVIAAVAAAGYVLTRPPAAAPSAAIASVPIMPRPAVTVSARKPATPARPSAPAVDTRPAPPSDDDRAEAASAAEAEAERQEVERLKSLENTLALLPEDDRSAIRSARVKFAAGKGYADLSPYERETVAAHPEFFHRSLLRPFYLARAKFYNVQELVDNLGYTGEKLRTSVMIAVASYPQLRIFEFKIVAENIKRSGRENIDRSLADTARRHPEIFDATRHVK